MYRCTPSSPAIPLVWLRLQCGPQAFADLNASAQQLQLQQQAQASAAAEVTAAAQRASQQALAHAQAHAEVRLNVLRSAFV